MSSDIVYAIRDFKAENEDELNFSIGEPIMILERDDEYLDGWWQGRNINGETGIFPKNCVSPEKPAQKLYKEFLQPNQDKIKVVAEIPARKPEQWNVQQVADWLVSVGHGSVSSNFIDQEITGDILLDLTIDTLKELGISTFGKRYKIMQAIQTLKQDVSVIVTPRASVSTSAISTKSRHKAPPPSIISSSISSSSSSTEKSRRMYNNNNNDVNMHLPRPFHPSPLPHPIRIRTSYPLVRRCRLHRSMKDGCISRVISIKHGTNAGSCSKVQTYFTLKVQRMYV